MSTIFVLLMLLHPTINEAVNITFGLSVKAQLCFHQQLTTDVYDEGVSALPGTPSTPRTAKKNTKMRRQHSKSSSPRRSIISKGSKGSKQLKHDNSSVSDIMGKQHVLPMMHDFIWNDNDKILTKRTSLDIESFPHFIPTNKSLSAAILLSNEELFRKDSKHINQRLNITQLMKSPGKFNPLSKPSSWTPSSKSSNTGTVPQHLTMNDIGSVGDEFPTPKSGKSAKSAKSSRSSRSSATSQGIQMSSVVKPSNKQQEIDKNKEKQKERIFSFATDIRSPFKVSMRRGSTVSAKSSSSKSKGAKSDRPPSVQSVGSYGSGTHALLRNLRDSFGLKGNKTTSSVSTKGSRGSQASYTSQQSGTHSTLMLQLRQNLELTLAKGNQSHSVDMSGHVHSTIDPLHPANVQLMDVIYKNEDRMERPVVPPQTRETERTGFVYPEQKCCTVL